MQTTGPEFLTLRERRLATGLTQQRLAELAGVFFHMVTLLGNGYAPAHGRVRAQVLTALDRLGARRTDRGGMMATLDREIQVSDTGRRRPSGSPRSDSSCGMSGTWSEAGEPAMSDRQFRLALRSVTLAAGHVVKEGDKLATRVLAARDRGGQTAPHRAGGASSLS
jgi:hypothetical protein